MSDIQTLIAKFSEYDFTVVLDGSGSMSGTDTPTGKSRWKYCQESIGAFVREIAEIDSDGIDFVWFNQSTVYTAEKAGPTKVEEIFQGYNPRGGTPMTEALRQALRMAGKSDKKDFILVVTDGEPDDQKSLNDLLVTAANNTPSDEALTILFVQVGRDEGATAFLKGLDNNLKPKPKYDIVDVKTIEEAEKFASISELVAAAIAD